MSCFEALGASTHHMIQNAQTRSVGFSFFRSICAEAIVFCTTSVKGKKVPQERFDFVGVHVEGLRVRVWVFIYGAGLYFVMSCFVMICYVML